MKAIIPSFNENSKRPYYLQLYDCIKNSILAGETSANEKLPSLRRLSKNLNLSLTTIDLAYKQLSVEGYIYSKASSGFFVSDISFAAESEYPNLNRAELDFAEGLLSEAAAHQYDLSCFDFNKWKKCLSKVLTDYPHLLLSEGDPQGEWMLRSEISKYLYRSRGVAGSPSQIVVGAGTQQITGQLSLFLSKMSIHHVTVEDPCYLPVKNIFRDRGFALTSVAVGKNGIDIKKLPTNIKSAVYVCPSNHFPTGAVMPVGRRCELLEWANRNGSVVIEDDYDSELRYFSKPIPALQGLDKNGNVVYLGSFSTTLFPSIKISYMVLPKRMADMGSSFKNDYTQTCSKAEQLALALFMQHGYYQTNIRKLRSLYSQKLQAVLNAIHLHADNFITPMNSSSGIYVIVNIMSRKSTEALCREAHSLGLAASPVSPYLPCSDEGGGCGRPLILYYNQIPLDRIDPCMQALISKWQA
ncbi:MAG: PLP-dependent aminotransferase family protein [Clostridiales bacterium]|nr:PLP-dependent aminotransferase family protein [Clostridiales bacterium]